VSKAIAALPLQHKSARYELFKIAQKVRNQLYQIAKIMNNGNVVPKHLGGWCQHGSILLFITLEEAGFKPRFVSGHGHFFVICENYLIDITASQFGQAKIAIRKYKDIKKMIESEEYQMNYWKAIKISDSLCDAGVCATKKLVIDARKKINTDPEPEKCNLCKQEEMDHSSHK
jgi:hypothetical protein